MKNNLNAQETAPSLTESTLPNKSPFLVWFWSIILAASVLSMAIAAIAIVSLTNTGSPEKDLNKQTTVASQAQSNSTGRNLLLVIALLGTGAAIYKWRHRITLPKSRRSRRPQRQLLVNQGEMTTTTVAEIPPLVQQPEPIVVDDTPIVTLLPPEEPQLSNLGEQSLAEMMDIRQHLSLSAILQDFKRPD